MSATEQAGIAYLLDRISELRRERTSLLKLLRESRRSRDVWRARCLSAERELWRKR